jgi:3-oxoadipate enol-lactonase
MPAMQASPDRITLHGLDIAYQTVGPRTSPAVVLLHGWASSLRMWVGTQGHLAERFRTYALDLPGHGESSKPDWSWYSIPNFVGVVQAFLAELGLEGATLIGHSMGGTIALELAAREDPRIDRVVAVNAVVSGQVYSRAFAIPGTWVEPALRVSRRVWPAASRVLQHPPAAVRRRTSESALRNTEDLGRTTADSALGSLRAVLAWDLRDRLHRIRARTLIVVGEADHLVSPAEGAAAAGAVPGARLVRLKAAHHPNDEVPETFYPVLDAFLTEGAAI